jgi:hypothetical protein
VRPEEVFVAFSVFSYKSDGSPSAITDAADAAAATAKIPTLPRVTLAAKANPQGGETQSDGQPPARAGEAQGEPTQALTLFAPAPNPASDYTTVRYFLPKASSVRLDLVDVLGRHSIVFTEPSVEAGIHSVVVPMHKFPTGTYTLHLRADAALRVAPVVIVR